MQNQQNPRLKTCENIANILLFVRLIFKNADWFHTSLFCINIFCFLKMVLEPVDGGTHL